MAAIFYYKDNGKNVYIKEIDFAKGTLTFTNNKSEARKDRDGYYAKATRDLIRRNFGEDYPQVQNLEVIADYF